MFASFEQNIIFEYFVYDAIVGIITRVCILRGWGKSSRRFGPFEFTEYFSTGISFMHR